MKTTPLAVTIALLFSTTLVPASAFATGKETGGTNKPNATANARATADANATATNNSYIRSTITNKNYNKNHNENTNQQEQQQNQQQNQEQGQTQSTQNANNASQTTTVGGSSLNFEASDNPVSSAYAPTVFPTAPCMGSTTGGAQTGVFGFSIGATWESKDCMMLETARSFEQAGYAEDALAIRCKSKYAKDAPSCKALLESNPQLQ